MTKPKGDDFPVPPPEEPAKPAEAPPDPNTTRRGQPRQRAEGAGRKRKAEVLEGLRESLTEGLGKAGASMMAIPWTAYGGAYIFATADDLTTAAVKLADRNPRMLKWLQTSAEYADWSIVLNWALGLAAAFAVQYQMIPPDGLVSKAYGIDEIAETFAKEQETHGGPEVEPTDDGEVGPALAAPGWLGQPAG